MHIIGRKEKWQVNLFHFFLSLRTRNAMLLFFIICGSCSNQTHDWSWFSKAYDKEEVKNQAGAANLLFADITNCVQTELWR